MKPVIAPWNNNESQYVTCTENTSVNQSYLHRAKSMNDEEKLREF